MYAAAVPSAPNAISNPGVFGVAVAVGVSVVVVVVMVGVGVGVPTTTSTWCDEKLAI